MQARAEGQRLIDGDAKGGFAILRHIYLAGTLDGHVDLDIVQTESVDHSGRETHTAQI